MAPQGIPAAQRLQPVGAGARAEDRFQYVGEDRSCWRPASARVEPSIGFKRPSVDDAAKERPELVVRDADIDPSVARLERLIGADGGMHIAASLRAFSRGEVHARVEGQQRRHGIEHRDVDTAAVHRPLALHQGGENGLRRIETRDEIGDGRADLHRRTVRLAGDVHDAGLALDDQVVSRPPASGPVRPKPEMLHWMSREFVRAQRLVGQPPFVERSGPEVLDHDVRDTREGQDDVAAGGRLQVDRAAALVAVDRKEIGALAADERRPVAAALVPVARDPRS